MTLLEIIKYGNPILTKVAEEVRDIDEDILKLAQDMVHTMHSAPGIGLAAPQVSQSRRLITVDLSVGEKAQDLMVLINPEILSQDGEQCEEEGCLSVPEVQEKVIRPHRVLLRGFDLDGNERRIEAEGLLARVFCHEVDHINGKLFIEHLSPLKKSLIKKKLRKSLD